MAKPAHARRHSFSVGNRLLSATNRARTSFGESRLSIVFCSTVVGILARPFHHTSQSLFSSVLPMPGTNPRWDQFLIIATSCEVSSSDSRWFKAPQLTIPRHSAMHSALSIISVRKRVAKGTLAASSLGRDCDQLPTNASNFDLSTRFGPHATASLMIGACSAMRLTGRLLRVWRRVSGSMPMRW